MKQIEIVIITILYFFINQHTYAQSKIYFDEDWAISNKENAHFYRIINKKNDSLFYVKDFYINNVLQMDGHFSNLKDEVLEGKINWYNVKGKITNSKTYTKGILNGISTLYLSDGQIYTCEYKNGEIYDGIYFGATAKYVYKKGTLIKKIGYDPPNDYYILSTIIYGEEIDSVYWYNVKGEKLGLGIYKNNKIQDGLDVANGLSNTFFTNYKNFKKEGIQKVFGIDTVLLSEKTFENDTLMLDKTLNPLTDKTVECIYKNNRAFQGRFFEYNPIYEHYDEFIFENGELITKNRYKEEDGKLKQTKSTSF